MGKLRNLITAAMLAVSFGSAASAVTVTDTIEPGAPTSTYSTQARGYWFTAPTDFVITGLDIPTYASTDGIYATIVKINTTVPLYPTTTTSYTVLYQVLNSSTALTGLNISVAAGEQIGVLGYRGGVNAMSSSPYVLDLFGYSTTLRRFGVNGHITGPAGLAGQAVWGMNSGSMSFVSLSVAIPGEPELPAVPLPASAPLLAAGLGLIAVVRRRKSA